MSASALESTVKKHDARALRWRSSSLCAVLATLSITSWSGLLPFLSMHLIPATPALMWCHTLLGICASFALALYLWPHLQRARGQERTPHYRLGLASLAVFVAAAASALPLMYGYRHVVVESAHTALSIAFVVLIATHFAAVIGRLTKGVSVQSALYIPLIGGLIATIAVLLW